VDRRSAARQFAEQYFTFSQSRAHFFRHVNGLPQAEHGFDGRSALRRTRFN
jgi:hypothetical protein